MLKNSVLSASGATVSNRMRPLPRPILLRPGPIPSDDGGVDSVVGTGLACAVGGEDEFCTVTGLALLVGFFGGPILGGYVATARQSRRAYR